jgi:hypothetical protein
MGITVVCAARPGASLGFAQRVLRVAERLDDQGSMTGGPVVSSRASYRGGGPRRVSFVAFTATAADRTVCGLLAPWR